MIWLGLLVLFIFMRKMLNDPAPTVSGNKPTSPAWEQDVPMAECFEDLSNLDESEF